MYYVLPVVSEPAPVHVDEVVLIASGDLRESANHMWPAAVEDGSRRDCRL